MLVKKKKEKPISTSEISTCGNDGKEAEEWKKWS